jgi:enoyl-CoA hydratase/carnithine racemase
MLSASQFAQQLASQAPLAVRAMLQVIDQVEQGQLNRSEADRLVALCAGSADLKEGLLAQRERRAPQFTGE